MDTLLDGHKNTQIKTISGIGSIKIEYATTKFSGSFPNFIIASTVGMSRTKGKWFSIVENK